LAEVDTAADAEMISTRTLKRAKKELRIRSVKGGMEGGWMWEKPEPGQESTKGASQKCWRPSENAGPLRDSSGAIKDELTFDRGTR
jgi:hypothetical protein